MNGTERALPEGKNSFTPEELFRFTKVKPFVLRYWESEFPSLKPKDGGSAGPAYNRADVEMILEIRKLLYDEGLTLAEARVRLSGAAHLEAGQEREGPAGTKRKKAKTVARKPAAAKKPRTIGNKRGLPGAEPPRKAVSFEELLPDSSGAAESAAPDGNALPGSPAKGPGPGPEAAMMGKNPDQRVMRRALSSALAQLREMLTFLDKGDR